MVPHSMDSCVYACPCVCFYVCTLVYVHIQAHTNTHARTHTHIQWHLHPTPMLGGYRFPRNTQRGISHAIDRFRSALWNRILLHPRSIRDHITYDFPQTMLFSFTLPSKLCVPILWNCPTYEEFCYREVS